MNYVDLGGLQAPAIGVGCMRIASMEPAALSRYMHTAIECGANFFDHADIYGGGGSETVFGQVLAQEPGLREKVILQSKCGIRKGMYDFSKEHILQSVDGILGRLKTDRLDLLLLHRPDALMEPEEVAEAFARLEASGKVARFGVSNFNARQMELLQAGVKQKLVANQLQFGLMWTRLIDHALCTNTAFPHSADLDGEVLDYCRLKGVTIQAWSPFQYGFFEGVFLDNEKFPELNAKLAELGEKYGASKQAMAAAWILRHPARMQVICGTTNPQRLADIATACEVQLTREDWYALYLAAGNQLP
ncbi:aldo/keto reductase [Acutalibacter caecimuris]|uniref:aldo/keto reductase n=1 Tax=Acutalibacter caecimuris TaxID=3093657 RepID=UPI002AC909B2|nr:aldo/keto reductase [Acutalibacter sp. M00118]